MSARTYGVEFTILPYFGDCWNGWDVLLDGEIVKSFRTLREAHDWVLSH